MSLGWTKVTYFDLDSACSYLNMKADEVVIRRRVINVENVERS